MRYATAIVTAFVVLIGSSASAPAFLGLGKDKADKAAMHQSQPMSLDQVPAPVRTTLEREAKGGVIGEVTLETTKAGKTYYDGQVRLSSGKERFIHVAASGKVLKRDSTKREARARMK